MLLATVTFGGLLTLVGLIVLLMLACIAFAHWLNYGGLLGWWLANDMFKLIGIIIAAIIDSISDMRN